MPFVVAHDVYRGIKTAFDADAAAVALFPGGLHAERKPPTELWPYGVVKVDDVDFAQDSGPLVIHVFEATVTAWKDASSAATTGDLARALNRVLDNLAAVPNATRVIQTNLRPGTLTLSPELRRGSDVCAAAVRWRIILEANRGS